MKYCGVVTDVSYLDAYSEVEDKDKENYKYFAHDRIPNRPRIYTDEVPMADEMDIGYFKTRIILGGWNDRNRAR